MGRPHRCVHSPGPRAAHCSPRRGGGSRREAADARARDRSRPRGSQRGRRTGEGVHRAVRFRGRRPGPPPCDRAQPGLGDRPSVLRRLAARAGAARRRRPRAGDGARARPALGVHHPFSRIRPRTQRRRCAGDEHLSKRRVVGAAVCDELGCRLYRQANALDEGLAELARTSPGREADPYIRFSRAGLQAAKGNRAEALPVAREFERLSASNPAWATFAARLYMVARGLRSRIRDVEPGD